MPGTTIRERTARAARSLPTNVGTLFLTGLSEKGEFGLAESLADFKRKFGDRQSYSSAYDMADAFFRTGGRLLYFSRNYGPAAVKASVTLNDAGAASSLIIRARSVGEWANTRNVAVVAGDAAGEFKIVITDDVDTSISEATPSFVDTTAAITWFSNHDELEAVAGASALDPAIVAAQSLAGGTDDRNNISDNTALTALNWFGVAYGPGQVACADRTTATAHGQIADHAAANNRAALYDPTDTTSKATLLTAASSVRGLANGKYGALFAPWVKIPGVSTGGAARSIPPSAVVAGCIANLASQGFSANAPVAGINGIVPYVSELKAEFNDADANELNEASVNLIRDIAGDFRIYGWRSGISKSVNPDWWQFGNVRLYMEIAAKADNILERFVLREIDGRGLVFGELEGQLTAMLLPYWEKGSLYGVEPSDAFYVDTSSQVNTVETINNGEIHAVIELTMSPMGETVILDIVKRAIGG